VLLYRLRWQIELLFKLWKSYCGLKAIGQWRRDRVLTELYAKLLGVLLVQILLAPLRIPDEARMDRELSAVQVRKLLGRFAVRLNQALAELSQVEHLLQQLLAQILRFAFKQKRKTKPNVGQRLALA